MNLEVQVAWLAAVFLLALRLGPLFVLAPVFGSAAVPVNVRVLFALALSASLVSAHPDWRTPDQAHVDFPRFLARVAAPMARDILLQVLR